MDTWKKNQRLLLFVTSKPRGHTKAFSAQIATRLSKGKNNKGPLLKMVKLYWGGDRRRMQFNPNFNNSYTYRPTIKKNSFLIIPFSWNNSSTSHEAGIVISKPVFKLWLRNCGTRLDLQRAIQYWSEDWIVCRPILVNWTYPFNLTIFSLHLFERNITSWNFIDKTFIDKTLFQNCKLSLKIYSKNYLKDTLPCESPIRINSL